MFQTYVRTYVTTYEIISFDIISFKGRYMSKFRRICDGLNRVVERWRGGGGREGARARIFIGPYRLGFEKKNISLKNLVKKFLTPIPRRIFLFFFFVYVHRVSSNLLPFKGLPLRFPLSIRFRVSIFFLLLLLLSLSLSLFCCLLSFFYRR